MSKLLLLLGFCCLNACDGQLAGLMFLLKKQPWVLPQAVEVIQMQAMAGNSSGYSLSAECMQAMTVYGLGLGELKDWAGMMADSDAVPPPGILEGHVHWTGSYEECLRSEATGDVINMTTPQGFVVPMVHDFGAKYCKAMGELPIPDMPPFAVGVCFPDKCSEEDITHILSSGSNALPVTNTYCSKDKKLEDESAAIACLAVIGFFGLLVLLATLVDGVLCSIESHPEDRDTGRLGGQDTANVPVVDHGMAYTNSVYIPGPDEKSNGASNTGVTNGIPVAAAEEKDVPKNRGKALKALLAFSLYTNLPSVLSGSMPKGSYTCMNGLRFISVAWIMLGHTWMLGIAYCIDCMVNPTENYFSQFEHLYDRWTMKLITNFDLAVEPFFVLSGCLVTISFLKTLEASGGNPGIGGMVYYYVHRYIRLTPVYAMVIFIYTTLFDIWGEGPTFPDEVPDVGYCKDNWWADLLYIGNFYQVENQCMGWTWYLMVDFQCYLIAPLFIFFLYKWPAFGGFFLFLGYGGQLGATVYYNRQTESRVVSYAYEHIYTKPWGRFGTYAIGMALGFIMYRTKCKVKMPRVLAVLGWLVAIALCLVATFLMNFQDFCQDCDDHWSWNWTVAYNAGRRDVYGLGIAWVIFACCTGYGGVFNSVLSWSGFAPLARLTYVIFIIHPIILFYEAFNRMRLIYVSDLMIVMRYCSVVVLGIVGALVVSLLFEVPILQLEKALFPRKKKEVK